jgi:hypothetical protein
MLHHKVKSHYKSKPSIPNQNPYTAHGEIVFGKTLHTVPTAIGIEIEIERVTKLTAMSFWRAEADGSLRDDGWEFITPPLEGPNVYYAVEEFYNKFLKDNTNAHFTHRCSIHVHLNVSNLTVGQLRALYATYMTLEDLFFKLVAPERKGNSYCYPVSDAFLSWEELSPDHLSEAYKYMAVNPHHLRDYGTIEFRHHGGTKEKKELMNWIDTITQLYKFVTLVEPEEIEKMIMGLNTTSKYYDFCLQALGSKFQQFNNVSLYDAMRNNVTTAKVFLS